MTLWLSPLVISSRRRCSTEREVLTTIVQRVGQQSTCHVGSRKLFFTVCKPRFEAYELIKEKPFLHRKLPRIQSLSRFAGFQASDLCDTHVRTDKIFRAVPQGPRPNQRLPRYRTLRRWTNFFSTSPEASLRPLGNGFAEIGVGGGRRDPPSRCSMQKTFLKQKGLVDILDGLPLLPYRCGNGFDTHRSPLEFVDDGDQDFSIHRVQA